MAEVNLELYEFLKENETGLYTQEFEKNKTVFAFVHVYFFNLEQFSNIVSRHCFDEGGLEVKMFDSTICIELNDIIEWEGHLLSTYKNCFNEHDWNNYKDEISIMEGEE